MTVMIRTIKQDFERAFSTNFIIAISQIPEQTEYAYDMYYAVYIVITDSSTLYYGMNELVSTQNPLTLDDVPEVP